MAKIQENGNVENLILFSVVLFKIVMGQVLNWFLKNSYCPDLWVHLQTSASGCMTLERMRTMSFSLLSVTDFQGETQNLKIFGKIVPMLIMNLSEYIHYTSIYQVGFLHWEK